MDIWSLEKQMKAIEQRIKRIEQTLNLPDITPPEEPIAKQETPLQPQSIEPTLQSGNLLGIVAIICFVLAGGFIIKLSIDTGWLTPLRQVIIAALFGFGLIAVGLKALNLDKAYMSKLPATGIIVLYLSAFAAYRLYDLVTFETALALVSAISILCILLYWKIRDDLYTITAVIGAYLSPMILSFNASTAFSLDYFVICSITFSILSIWFKSRLMTMLAAYLAIFVTFWVGMDINQDLLLSKVLLLQFLVFATSIVLFSIIHQHTLTVKESWCFFPVLALFYAAEYTFLSRINHDMASWLCLVVAVASIVTYLIVQTFYLRREIASQAMVFTFAAVILFHSGYLELVSDANGIWIFIAIMLSLALLSQYPIKAKTSFINYLPLVVLAGVIIFIEYGKLMMKLDANMSINWLTTSLAIASFWLFLLLRSRSIHTNDNYILFAAVHVLVLYASYRYADPTGSLAVSALWLSYASAVILIAYSRHDKIMANSALIVLFFAAAKVFLYDAASAPTIVRILCLLSTGVVLYASGYLYRKIAGWKN